MNPGVFYTQAWFYVTKDWSRACCGWATLGATVGEQYPKSGVKPLFTKVNVDVGSHLCRNWTCWKDHTLAIL